MCFFYALLYVPWAANVGAVYSFVFLLQDFIRSKLRMKMKNERSKRRAAEKDKKDFEVASKRVQRKRSLENIGLKNYAPPAKMQANDVQAMYKLKSLHDSLCAEELEKLKTDTFPERRRLVLRSKGHVLDTIRDKCPWLCEESQVRLISNII